MDYWSLKKIIRSVETNRALDIQTPQDFYSLASRGMKINNFNTEEALDIKPNGNDFLIHLKYERWEPLIENLHLVATFDKEFRVHRQ